MSNPGIGARLKIQFHRGTIVTVQKLSRHEFLVPPLPSMLGSRSSEQRPLAILRCLGSPTESGIGLAVWKGRHSFMKVAKWAAYHNWRLVNSFYNHPRLAAAQHREGAP